MAVRQRKVAWLPDLGGPGHVLSGGIFGRGRLSPIRRSPADGGTGGASWSIGGTCDGEGIPSPKDFHSTSCIEHNPSENELFVMKQKKPCRVGFFKLVTFKSGRMTGGRQGFRGPDSEQQPIRATFVPAPEEISIPAGLALAKMKGCRRKRAPQLASRSRESGGRSAATNRASHFKEMWSKPHAGQLLVTSLSGRDT